MKIAILIRPNPNITKIVNFWKKKIKTSNKKFLYISNIPHLTLITTKIKKIDQIKKKINFFIKSQKDFNLRIKKTGYFSKDLVTGGDTPYFRIEYSKKLFNLQKELAELLKNCSKKKIELNLKGIYKKSQKKYGFPYIGDHWKPHISVCSVLDKINKIYLKKFLSLKINLYFKIGNIYLYKVVNNKLVYIKKFNFYEKD